ncbi:hypothetical protein Y032_0040g209 [Ancylostoma ceylanicum]|uniref:Uncharacterized protein n=1 Tax=Ancylostoma ceylanicum TaxID=53326 RepID=A0A016UGI9_9BILA|nr:hypothetical protein Y032_0040g209 [Ancylostoma ceylanicum]
MPGLTKVLNTESSPINIENRSPQNPRNEEFQINTVSVVRCRVMKLTFANPLWIVSVMKLFAQQSSLMERS